MWDRSYQSARVPLPDPPSLAAEGEEGPPARRFLPELRSIERVLWTYLIRTVKVYCGTNGSLPLAGVG